MVSTGHIDIRGQRARRKAGAMTAALLAAFGASSAQAGYSVQTSANTGRGYNRGCAATYNTQGTGAKFINNAGGGAPCDPNAFLVDQGAVVTATGTTDTTGLATAAHDELSDVRLPDTAFATANANLATGKVGLTASAANFAGADSSARLVDTLHFTIAGATASTITYVPVSFSFAGTLTAPVDATHSSAELTWGFYFGNASTYEYGDYGAGYFAPPNYPTFAFPEAVPGRTAGWQSYSFASYTPTDTRFSGLYAITGTTADIPIDFRLALTASNVALDYLDTGNLAIGHVAGVSYTSDSGVFLSAAGTVGGVPEPASWVMLVAGFGIVGALVRRRRITVAA